MIELKIQIKEEGDSVVSMGIHGETSGTVTNREDQCAKSICILVGALAEIKTIETGIGGSTEGPDIKSTIDAAKAGIEATRRAAREKGYGD